MTLFTAIKKWLHRMFGKTEEKTVQPVKTKKKLSRADKKQIEAAIARANRTNKKGKSAQVCADHTDLFIADLFVYLQFLFANG